MFAEQPENKVRKSYFTNIKSSLAIFYIFIIQNKHFDRNMYIVISLFNKMH